MFNQFFTVMKKLFTILTILVIASAFTFGQRTPVDDLFDKYSGQEGITTVLISEGLFKIISDMDEESGSMDGDLKKLKGITSLRVLAVEDEALNKELDFFAEVDGNMDWGAYEELMIVKDGNENVRMLAQTDGDVVKEFLIIVGGEDNVLVSIKGDITKKILSEWTEESGPEELLDSIE